MKSLVKELRKHLSILKRQGVIREWYDREITAGTDWKGQIDQHLNSAGVILLLVSADFLASDYCYDVEMTRALERHGQGEARVIPVILREVEGWQLRPIRKLQSLPTDGKPVTSWNIRDEAFADVARGIRNAIGQLGAHQTSPRRASFRSSCRSPGTRLRRPHRRPRAAARHLADGSRSRSCRQERRL